MELTFLGTGAAVATHAYNVALLIDRTLLLDAGAPLSVHLPRAGVSIDGPRAVILTHFHADHTFGLAWLILGRILLEDAPPPLAILGPAGTQAHVRQLVELAWGPEMLQRAIDLQQIEVRELAPGERFEVEGYQGTAYQMTHTSRFSCLGYVLTRGGVRLGYSGDAELSAGLEALLGASNHAVVEMTYDTPGPMHLSRVEVEGLQQRHPSVRFILTHLGREASLDGAVAAHDFLTLHLPLP
ncbi:MAG: MBL fold metallo-hydrolase [Candidatus Dormibacteraeota bacterium]|nr:MBL fold metallo-hydrolase [Candidatus Dormibacteraeota bacterium]